MSGSANSDRSGYGRSSDARFMRRALQLAARARGRVSPNPIVGAVVVDPSGQIVGEGYHRNVGGPHAEAHALNEAGDRARGSTVYCTLEPCAHHGRTPPCAEALVRAGVRRVVCSLHDPDTHVSGKGFTILTDAGIDVEIGPGAATASAQNAGYLHHRQHGRPRVWLKLAQSLDGRIATRTGDSRWITGETARRHSHRWRSWMDMVAVGAGTVTADDPALTVRHVKGQDPRALVVSGRLTCAPQARVFGRAGTVVATGHHSPERTTPFTARGTEVWAFNSKDDEIDLAEVVQQAGSVGITSLLIEGGQGLAAAALRARIVDELMIYVAPRLIGEGLSGIGELGIERIDDSIGLTQVTTRRLGEDLLVTGKVESCSPV